MAVAVNSPPSKTFWLETFGCQMNVHDSERIAGTLMAYGYRPVEAMEQADFILFNTCSIRDKAAQKVFSRLAQFKALRRDGKRFGVLGCVAQQEGEAIFERAPHVDLVCGSASYPILPELLRQLDAGETRVTGLEAAGDEAFETELTRRDHPYRAYATIIEGCDKHCAYCVVPYTRGKERSRASAAILREIEGIVAMGYTEVQLLGQNVNSYRDPSSAHLSFAELLAAVAEVPGLRRVRFTTSHPRDFTPDIIEVLGTHPTLCDHVHLPVQSGSDAVLRLMRREYTRGEYLERVAAIRACPRPLALTTDLIVGFPGETAEDFERTVDLLEEVRYAGAFIFQYSPRPHTEALERGETVTAAEKTERLMLLQRRQQEIQSEDNQSWVGRSVEVMVEGFHEKLEQWSGRTSQNRVVNFVSSAAPSRSPAGLPPILGQEPAGRRAWGRAGEYTEVRVVRAGANSLVGEEIPASIV